MHRSRSSGLATPGGLRTFCETAGGQLRHRAACARDGSWWRIPRSSFILLRHVPSGNGQAQPEGVRRRVGLPHAGRPGNPTAIGKFRRRAAGPRAGLALLRSS